MEDIGVFHDIFHRNPMGFDPFMLSNIFENKIKASAVVEFQHSGFRLSQNCRFHGCLQILELLPRVSSLVSTFINTPEVILMRLVLDPHSKQGPYHFKLLN